MTAHREGHHGPAVLIAVFAALALGIGCAGYVYHSHYRERTRQQQEETLEAIADLKVRQIAAWWRERRGDAGVILTNRLASRRVAEYLAGSGAEPVRSELLAWMDGLVRHYGDEYERVALLDARGRVRLSVGPCPEPIALQVREGALEAMRSGTVVVRDLHRDSPSGDIHLSLLVPVRVGSSPAAPSVGAFLLRVDPRRFLYPLIRSWPTPTLTAETLLVRREGDDVVFLNELRHWQNTALRLRRPIAEERLSAAMAARGVVGTVEGRDYRGVEVLAAMRKVPGTSWALVAKMDLDELYAPLSEHLWLVVFIVFGLIVTSGATVLHVWRQHRVELLRRAFEAQAQQQAQSRLLDAIFDNILAQVAYLDADFRFVRVNATYAEGCGHSMEELIGKNHFELFPNDENLAIFTGVRDTGEPYIARAKPFEFADQPERGVTYWDWWLRPIRTPDGVTEGLVLSLVDVTAVERGRREVERLNRELRDANAAKDQFLAVLSHELRNPLSPILAGVSLIRRSLDDRQRALRALDIIERNARLQTRLVNDLLDLSRIARNKMQFQRAPAALDAVLRAAIQDQQAEADEAGVSLVLDAAPDLWVMGDFERLQQVVLNLLSNAIKFTPAGGTITVTAARVDVSEAPGAPVSAGEGGLGRIVLTDTGMGIDRAMLEELFEMFRQGEVGGQRGPGLGIGLALVRSIVERHGGHVWAESEGPGRGSRFSVELPLIAGPDRDGAAAPEESRSANVRVLIVEDNEDTRALLAESLAVLGYEVQVAASAEEALGLVEQEPPEVILSDIGLPGMDGYEFLRRARQMPGMAGVTAFCITGLGQEQDILRAREAGYSGHFVKPVDVGALDRRLRDWLAAQGRL